MRGIGPPTSRPPAERSTDELHPDSLVFYILQNKIALILIHFDTLNVYCQSFTERYNDLLWADLQDLQTLTPHRQTE